MKAEDNYIKAVNKGLLKVLSKMGTSTLRSYRGAQIFEAVGLGSELDRSLFHRHRIAHRRDRHQRSGARGAHAARDRLISSGPVLLESQGVYQYRKDGERHAWNPETIHLLQWATRSGDYAMYRKFSDLVNEPEPEAPFHTGTLRFQTADPDSRSTKWSRKRTF